MYILWPHNLTWPNGHWGHTLAQNLSLVRVKVHFASDTSPWLIVVPRWEEFLGAVGRVMAVRWRRIVQLKAVKVVLPTFYLNVKFSCQMSDLQSFHLMSWLAMWCRLGENCINVLRAYSMLLEAEKKSKWSSLATYALYIANDFFSLSLNETREEKEVQKKRSLRGDKFLKY